MSQVPVRNPQRPVDADHALRIGHVAGVLAMASEVEPLTGVNTRGVEILDDAQGNHLDAIRLHARSGTFLVSIERESYTGVCRDCGCTEDEACQGGCSWTSTPNLCSRCA